MVKVFGNPDNGGGVLCKSKLLFLLTVCFPFLTHHLVSALGPALVCFVLLASLVGYYVRRMKVFVLAYDQPIVL